MGGTIKAPLSQETRDLFKENQKFFEALAPALSEAKLMVKMGDPETRTETKALENGDIEVTFVYPLDDNNDAADGRLYLRDKFLWDAKESQIKTFNRDYSYNGEGNRESWKPLLAKMQGLKAPDADTAAQFGMTAGRSYSRPFGKEVKDILKTKVDYFNAVAPILQEEGLQIKLPDADTHYTLIHHAGKNGLPGNTELIFSYVINDADEKTGGKAYLRDSFLINANGEVLGYDRKWDVDVNASAADKKLWKERAARLAAKAKPSNDEAKNFIKGFVPAIYNVHPTFTAETGEYVPPTAPEGGFVEMNPKNFTMVMDAMVSRKKTLTGDKIEPDLLQTMPQLKPYFAALEEAVKPEIALKLDDPRTKFSTFNKGDGTTVVTMEMTLSEGSWAESGDGVVRYKERFIFEKGQIKDVDRSWKIDGADSKGRLAAVVTKLDQAKAAGAFPPAQSMPTALVLAGVLPYVAPELIYTGQAKVVDQEGLDFDRKMLMGTLGQIHENLKSTLALPGIDPKFASRLNRALMAVQHGDVETFQASIGQIEKDASEALKTAGDAEKKGLQDIKAVTMIISLTVGAQFDEAKMIVDHLHSPLLKAAFDKPIDQIWRRKHVFETLDIAEKLALDDAAKRALDSSAWSHSGPRLDSEAEQKIALSLFQKAKAFSVGDDSTDTKETLKKLRQVGEGKKPEELSDKEKALMLTEDEKKAADRIIGNEIFKKLLDIEKEASKEMQAKLYFELARGEVFEKGYIGTAQFLAQKVAITKMPKSRAQEGLMVLGEAAGEIFQIRDQETAAKKSSQAVKDMTELYKSDQKKYEEVYKAELEEVNKDPQLQQLTALTEAAKSLGAKWAQQAGAKPGEPLMALLGGLTDVNESEKLMAKLIAQDPTFNAIAQASTGKTREERMKGYIAALQALVDKDPNQQEMVGIVAEYMNGDKFPSQPHAEALALILNLASLPIGLELSQSYERLLIDKVSKNAEAKAKKESGFNAEALSNLMAKAKLKAASTPDANALDVLKSLKDDELQPEEKKLRDELVAHPSVAAISQLSTEPKYEERAKKYKAFSEGIAKKTAFMTVAQQLLQMPTAEAREGIIKKLEGVDEKKRLDKGLLEKLSALAKETSAEKRTEMVEGFKKDPAFKEAGMVQLSLWMDQMVTMGKIPEPEYVAQDPRKAEADKFANDVKQFIDLTEGKGNFGTKVGYGMPHFVKEVSRPTMLAAMFGAGLIGPYVELRSLYAMRNMGTFGRGLAVVAGIGAESLAFNTFHKIGDSTFYHSKGQWDNFGKDTISTMVLFGAMRAGHYATGTFADAVLASGRPGFKWAGGRVVGEPGTAVWTTPAGKIFIPKAGLKPGVPQLTAAGKSVKGVLDHTAGIGSMMGAGYVNRFLKLQKDNGQDWKGNLSDAIIGYTHAMIGFSLANRATGGSFHQMSAELKLRGQNVKADPDVIKARTEAALKKAKDAGLLTLINGERNDVQLTDMKDGKNNAEVKLQAGEKGKDEHYLDQALLGEEGQAVIIRKKADGSLVLIDTRTHVKNDGVEPGTLFKETTPIEVDGKAVEPNVETPLAEGQVIRAGERQLGVSLPAQSPLVEALSKLTHDGEAKLSVEEIAQFQMRLAQKLAKAKDLTGLLESLKEDWRPGGPLMFEILNAIIEGKLTLHNLPRELNLQSRITELMKAEVEKMAKDVNLKDFELEADSKNPKWSQVELEFHTAQKVRSLREGVSMSQEVGHILHFLKESNLKTIDGVPAETVREWVEWQSLKIRKNDVNRELEKAKSELEALEPKAEPKTETAEPNPENGEAKTETKPEAPDAKEKAEPAEPKPLDAKTEKAVAELKVRIQQLEKTLKVVESWLKETETEMAAKGDQAEIPSAQGVRQKTLDILGQETKPIQDVLSKEDGNALLKLVQKYLEYHVPEDVGVAQSLLRAHLDQATPRAKKLLIYASPKAKELIFRAYLGEPPVRQMSETAASEIVSWLTQGGMESVAKVTYRTVGGRSVPHLEVSEKGYEGAKDGFNLIHARAAKAEGHEVLVTPAELKEIVQEAKDYVAQGQGEKNGSNSLFDAESRFYQNWVVHPEGGSQVKVFVEIDGKVSKVFIKYSTKNGETQLSTQFQAAKKEIEKAAEAEGIKVELVPMDLPKFQETLPGKVGSLGRLESFFKGYGDSVVGQRLAARGMKKKFESANPATGALPKKPGTPEWLSEFLKKYFDGAEFIPEREARERANAATAEKEAKTEEALKEFGLTREEILADPKIVQKRFRQFAARFHPDKIASLGDAQAEKDATKKFQEINDYNELLSGLVEKAKQNAENKGKPEEAAKKKPEKTEEAKTETETKAEEPKVEVQPTAFEKGLTTFLNVVEMIPGGKVVIEIVKGIGRFFAKQWYGQGFEAELEANRAARVEKRAKKQAAEAAAAKAKEPKVPEKPEPAAPGAKLDAVRDPLPSGTVLPGTEIKLGEANLSDPATAPKISESAKEWMGEYAGRTDQGTGYALKDGQTEAKNEDGIARIYTKEGDLVLIDADGVGGHIGGKEATKHALETATAEIEQGASLDKALMSAHEAVVTKAPKKSGAVVVAAKILRPSKAGEPASLQAAFAGDAKLVVLRPTKDGELHPIYQTIEETLARQIEDSVPADKRQEVTERVGKENALLTVTNGLGMENSKIRLTAEGEVPDPANPGKMKKAEGLETIELKDGDIVLLASDGLWDNIPLKRIIELIKNCKTAEEARDVLHKEAHRRMEILDRANKAGFPDGARFQFEHEGKTLFIDANGYVFDVKEGGEAIDKYKCDNISLIVYKQNPTPPAAPSGPGGLPPGGGAKVLPEPAKVESVPPPSNPPENKPAAAPATDKNPTAEPATDKAPVAPDTLKTGEEPKVDAKAAPAPVAPPLKARFKSKTADDFFRDYGQHLTADGIKYPAQNPPAEGSKVRFEFFLADDMPFLSGEGTMVTLPPADPANPGKPKMAIKFDKLDAEAQKTWEQLQAKRNPPPAPEAPAPATEEASGPETVKTDTTANDAAPKTIRFLPNFEKVMAEHGQKFTGDGSKPVELPITFKFSSQQAFIDGFAKNLGYMGMTVPLKKPPASGAKVHFKVNLIDGTTLFSGLGTVVAHDAKDGAKSAPATDIVFDMLSLEAKEVLDQAAAKKRESDSGSKTGGGSGNGGGEPPAKPGTHTLGVPFNAGTPTELLAKYGKYFEADSIFIPTKTARPVGTKVAFSLRLKDGTVFMKGSGTVVEAPAHLKGAGMKVRFDELTPTSQNILNKIVEAKAKQSAPKLDAQAPKPVETPVEPAKPVAAPKVETPVPTLNMKTNAGSIDQFINGYPGRVGPQGLQIVTNKSLPTGSHVNFQFRAKDGSILLEGQGEVLGSFPADPKFPNRPVGVMVRFTDISEANRAIVDQMVVIQTKKAAEKKETNSDFDDEPTLTRVAPTRLPPPPGTKPNKVGAPAKRRAPSSGATPND